MVITKYFKAREDGVMLVITNSDKNKKIVQLNSNNVYNEAIDIGVAYIENGETKFKPKFYEYGETTEDIEVFDNVIKLVTEEEVQ